MSDDFPDDDVVPEFAVWNHLDSGVELAEIEFDVLDNDWRAFFKAVAKFIVDARSSLAHQRDTFNARMLVDDELLLGNPWIKHAADILIARKVMERGQIALYRYFMVRPAITAQEPPLRAMKYIDDVVQTFAFGFDAACIALCRATLEQVLKERLIASGEFTEAQLKKQPLTAGGLLANAKRLGIVKTSARAAQRLVDKGNTILHGYLYDEKVSEQQAKDSVTELIEVLSEVLREKEARPDDQAR